MKIRPSGITVNRENREVLITWDDGHESLYPFSLLRHACPCAECRGGHANMRAEPDPAVFTMPDEDSPATRMASLEAVGAYAITIAWEDGHHYGIYNWEYLRALCTCSDCRAEAENE